MIMIINVEDISDIYYYYYHYYYYYYYHYYYYKPADNITKYKFIGKHVMDAVNICS